jgi:ATP-dependent 26S proteasome regulatory subunit
MRPGRFDMHIPLVLPDRLARIAILKGALKSIPNSISASDIEALAEMAEGVSSATLINSCREAAMMSIRHCFDQKKDGMDAIVNQPIHTRLTCII